ncbi:MAG: DUF4129 domain-containing protein [Actinomycetota bacterium]|nr:DUF4129 domain-containing protein [Actinomycetota bacterium]
MIAAGSTTAVAALVLQADPGAPDPAEVAERVEQIMSRPEFDYGPSWFDQLAEWIGKQLERWFGDIEPSGAPPQGGQFLGGIGSILAWLIIIVAVLAVIGVAVYVIANRIRRPDGDDTPATETEIEHRRAASEWRSDAERLESEGEWKLALRARYRELVRTLVDRRQLPDVPGRTTGELREDLARTTPTAAGDFDVACLLFELPWYADAPTGADENAAFRAAATAVLSAPTVEPDDDSPGRGDGAGDSTLVVIG